MNSKALNRDAAAAADFRLVFQTLPGLCVLVSPDHPRFTVVDASDAYLQAVRQSRDAMVGRGLFEVFPEGPDEAHARTIRNVRASFGRVLATKKPDTLPVAQQYDLQDSSRLQPAFEERHWMLVSSPVLDEAGVVRFILHQIENVTERVVAEMGRRESEEHLRYTVELSTLVPWTADPQGQILDFSHKWLELTGLTREAALGHGWAQVPHPDDRPRMIAAWIHSISTGEPYDIEHRIQLADGSYRWMHTRALPRLDDAGHILRWYGTTEDIDERTQTERRNAFLVRLDDALRALTDPQAITQTAARMLAEHLSVNRCAYADVENDEDTFNLTGDYNRGVPSIVGRYTFAQFGADCLRLMREGKPYVVTDSELDERTAHVRDSYRLTLIRSVICVPLLKEGRFVAAMAVHDATPRQWQQHEVELVQQVAGRCWESIERARVSRQLHEREQRYRFLAESIPQMVWTAAPDGKLDYVNEQVTSYFGTTSGRVLGEGWLEWVHPEDRLKIVERWKHSLETGERYETAFRLLRSSDSSWRWHLVRATAMLSLHGETARWFGTCTDFEDQKQAEIDRRRTQELLQMVIDRVPGLVSYFDSDLRYAFTNSHYSEWFGAGPFVGRKVSEVIGEEAFARVWPYMERAFAGEEVNFEEFLPYSSSKPRYVQVSFSPHRTQHGTVDGVVATVQDITAQKTMEEALRRSEERLQQVFRQAPVAIIVLRGKDLVAELVNPFYQNLLQGRELIGRRFADVVPEIGSDVLQAFHQVMETGEPSVRDEFYIPYDQNGDGVNEDHWFNLVYHPLREPDGSVSGVVTVCNEVTVQVRARQELERLNRELEEFAYVASHDLQEPLRMVNIYTQLLLRRYGGDTPQAREYASIIHTGVNRMEALIHDLLTFSRIIHSEESPAGLVDLSAAVAQAASVLKDRIEESRASIAAQQLPTVPGDTAQMAQVFQNLLSNAMKYQQNGTPPEIRITAECDDVNWTIAVKDNGIGFEPRYAERIFGLFRRLHKDEYPGTGLGLAICRRIIERHNGRIWAESTPGNGSTFYLSLPCRKEKT